MNGKLILTPENLAQKIPIVVITLVGHPTATKRMDFFEKQAKGVGIKYDIFDGVDGKNVNVDALTRDGLYLEHLSMKYQWRPFKKGEFGCYLSHVEIYRQMVEQGIERLIIMEDDAVFSPDFAQGLRQVQDEITPDMDLVMLHYYDQFEKQYKRDKPFLQRFFSNTVVYRTTAYIITMNAAKRLLKLCFPIYVPIDWITGMYGVQYQYLKSYIYTPMIVKHTGEDSIIKNDVRDKM